MNVKEKAIETCDDLFLSPLWRNPPPADALPRGLTKESALLNAWLRQYGKCADCGRHLDKSGTPAQHPVLIRRSLQGKDSLANLAVICAGCLEG